MHGQEGAGNIRPIARLVTKGTVSETIGNATTKTECDIYEFDRVVFKGHGR